tara:strand:- start:32 stop:979 length:948 start_codon:yes stop_codon:yes gene_type:complete
VKKFSLKDKKIWIAGHNGMVGQTILRKLRKDHDIITIPRQKLNLLSQNSVEKWMKNNKPEVVFLTAGKVGGIHANSNYPVDFLYQNILIAANVINAAYKNKVKKLIYLGSSCIYPKNVKQPMIEDQLLTGTPEPTNEWYAVAKIAGIKLCQAYRKQYGCDFISIMPTNLYGPGDNFHKDNSHVPAALLDRFHEAKAKKLKEVTVWGSGKPFREFMHVDDLADACIFLSKNYSSYEIINVGTGKEISIRDFAYKFKEIVGYKGKLIFNTSMPDGSPRKLLCTKKINSLGWKSKISLDVGLNQYYKWYKREYKNLRK